MPDHGLRTPPACALAALALAVSSCAGGGPGDVRSVGGTVSGLTGSGLVLQLNGGHDLTVQAGATSFQFDTTLVEGTFYLVTVLAQPSNPAEVCTVDGGAGTMGASPVRSISVVCSTSNYAVGGTVSSLDSDGLVLQLNSASDLPVPAGATSFQFATPVASGAQYAVTISAQPANESCAVENGSGTMGDAAVGNVSVVCSTNRHTVGGNVSGLSGTGLVLQLNGDPLPITTDGPFTFTTPIPSGSSYGVTVRTQPLFQTCAVANGAGQMGNAAVDDVAVTCLDVALTWSSFVSPTTKDLYGVWGSSSSAVWAVGDSGTTLLMDGSSSITYTYTSGTTNGLRGVWGTSASNVWAVGLSGTILRWKGTGWSSEASGTTSNLLGVFGTSASDVWAVGAGGTILRNRGAGWSSVPSGTTANLQEVWASSTTDAWAVGATGTTGVILRWNGTEWKTVYSGTTDVFWGVWGTSSSDVWAVGNSGTIVHWDGYTWSSTPSGVSVDLTSAWGSKASDVWVVGSFGTLVRRNGSPWASGGTSGVGYVLSGVWGSSAGDVWAVGYHGTVIRGRP